MDAGKTVAEACKSNKSESFFDEANGVTESIKGTLLNINELSHCLKTKVIESAPCEEEARGNRHTEDSPAGNMLGRLYDLLDLVTDIEHTLNESNQRL